MVHKVGEDIAWIFPPRTGTRYVKLLIEKQSFFDEPKCTHHEIISGNIGDRKLIVNIRNPYTRIQSWWRLMVKWRRLKARPPTNKFDREFYEYLINAEDLEHSQLIQNSFDDQRAKVKIQGWYRNMRYPLAISDQMWLNDVDPNRIDELVRMESFHDDLRRVGFEPNLPKTTGVGDKCEYTLEWYNDHPECIEIINRLYKNDFETFGYEML